MQHRTPVQSHDMPTSQRRMSSPRQRPGSRGRARRGGRTGEESPAANGAAPGSENQHPGHLMQHRSASASHGLSKRARSRSRGRVRSQQQQQQQQHNQQHSEASSGSGRRTPQDDQRFLDEANNLQMKRSSSFGNIADVAYMLQEGRINEYGQCVRHPNIELCCQDDPGSPWRVLLQDCPLCSLDEPGLSLIRPGEGNNRANNNDGGSSNKTNRTLTTEEETSSVKSWTMSDASTCELDVNEEDDSVCTKETFLKSRPPPPPPKRSPPLHQKGGVFQNQQSANNQQQNTQRQQQQGNNNDAFCPIQSLKELGRRLVMEQEAAEGVLDDASTGTGIKSQASSAVRSTRRPPPPPPPPPRERDTDDMSRMSSLSTKELSQMRRQQQRMNRARPPPRRGTGGQSAGLEESNESILGEASDIIARMESLTKSEASGVDSVAPPSRRNRNQQQQIIAEGGEEDLAAKAAAEKRARAQRRREKAERKAAKLRAREQLQQQQQRDGSETYTIPMNDTVPSRGRGREGRTDDILQAAAQIRARARRSTSRSRERVREAAIFCGETPSDNVDDEGDMDHLSLSSEKKRSILNPHGLENEPSPPKVERRSQSRERRRRRRSKSGGIFEDGEENYMHNQGRHSRERNPSRGRNREASGLSYVPQKAQGQSTAEELLERRREMRQKIAERRQNDNTALQRSNHRRVDSGGATTDDNMSLKEEVLEGWTRTISDADSRAGSVSRRSSRRGRAEDRGEPRRGRSRSAVRDGISKIRSASIGAIRRKKVIGSRVDLEDVDAEVYTVGDTSKRSTSSSTFKKLMSKPRSLSRSRRGKSTEMSAGVNEGRGGWANRSESFVDGDDGDDARSAAAKSVKSLSSGSRLGGMFKRKSMKKLSKSGGGLVRSLSRGSFRAANAEEANGSGSGEGWDEQQVLRSMRSNSPGRFRASTSDYYEPFDPPRF